MLLLLALVASCAAECANWCSRWTCNNHKFCSGCDAHICEGGNPHPMCRDEAQPYCGAPRCERWCSQATNVCSRDECKSCPSCDGARPRAGEAVVRPAASPFPAPETVKDPNIRVGELTCDEGQLTSLQSELRSMVSAQRSRNSELWQHATPAPQLQCVQLGAQCGGSSWTGPTTCCASALSSQPTHCQWFSDAFSGCREVEMH